MSYLVIPRGYSLTALGLQRLTGVPIAQFDDEDAALAHMKEIEQETGARPRCYHIRECEAEDMGIQTFGELLARKRAKR